jgi:ribonuclease-3
MKGPAQTTTPSSPRSNSASATAFKNRALLREALTHGSVHEGKKQRRDYDRLGVSGRSRAWALVAERLLAEHKTEQEGELAPRYNALVNRTPAPAPRAQRAGRCARAFAS